MIKEKMQEALNNQLNRELYSSFQQALLISTLGRSNKTKQIPVIVNAVRETVQRLRRLSPL